MSDAPIHKNENEELFWEEFKKEILKWDEEHILHRIQWSKACIAYMQKVLDKKRGMIQ